MMAPDIKRIDLDMRELETILDRAREGMLDEGGYRKLKGALEPLGYLTDLIGDKDTTIRRLRQIIFGSSTEKSSSVLGDLPAAAGSPKTEEAKDAGASAKDQEPKTTKSQKATAATALRTTPAPER